MKKIHNNITKNKINRNESSRNVYYDLFFNLKCGNQVIMLGLSIIISYLVIHYMLANCSCVFKFLTEKYILVFSITLGLSIAAYILTIVFHTEKIRCLLSSDKSHTFVSLCASMIFNSLMQVIAIITALVYLFYCWRCIFCLSTIVSFYALFQIIYILFHLFRLRRFIFGSEKQSVTPKANQLNMESNNQEVSFLRVFKDMWRLESCATRIMYVLIAVMTFMSCHCCCPCLFANCKFSYETITIFGTLLGFTMTGYAIIFNLSGNYAERHAEVADNGLRPFEVSCASFTFSIIFQIFAILFAFLTVLTDNPIWKCLTITFISLSIYSLMDIALTLFSLRTIFVHGQTDDDDKKA